jgi:ribose-phosphate pyrophosphokinase
MLKLLLTTSAEYFRQVLSLVGPEAGVVDAKWTTFKNGEVKCTLLDGIRGDDCYVVADVANMEIGGSVNDRLMELIVAIDTAKHASPSRITVVIPTFPYARQHKKSGREGLTASWICHILEKMRVQRLVTLDLHCSEIENAFHNTVVENLHASYQIAKAASELVRHRDLVVVAPDIGAMGRNRYFAEALRTELACIYKERDYNKVSTSAADSNIKSMQVLGDVRGKDVLIVDDMIDTGGTILKSAEHLRNSGAKRVIMACSLPFFNGTAIADFEAAFNKGVFTKVIGTDAVFNPKLWEARWFEKTTILKLFGEVIRRLHSNISCAELMDAREVIKKKLEETNWYDDD